MQKLNKYSLPFNKHELEPLIESIIYDEIFQQPNLIYSKQGLLNKLNEILIKIVPIEKAEKISLTRSAL